MDPRKAYVILALISIFTACLSFYFSVRVAHNSEKAFCDIVNAVTANPPPKPADPQKDPSREHAYEFYLKFKVLDTRLGC
jgi:hypothetical protein